MIPRSLSLIFLIALAFTSGAHAASRPSASAEDETRLVVDLSINKISIEANFSGERILLFGALNGVESADIVIAIRGPSTQATLRQKQRQAGIWINGPIIKLGPMPAFYGVLSNRPVSEIAPASTLQTQGIGIETLSQSLTEDEAQPDFSNFTAAHARLKRGQGLYFENHQGVDILSNRLFRSEIQLPSGTPRGTYHIDFFMFENGRLTAMQASSLDVDYAGLENFLFSLAHGMPLLYGLLGIAIAVTMGWGTATLFRRS